MTLLPPSHPICSLNNTECRHCSHETATAPYTRLEKNPRTGRLIPTTRGDTIIQLGCYCNNINKWVKDMLSCPKDDDPMKGEELEKVRQVWEKEHMKRKTVKKTKPVKKEKLVKNEKTIKKEKAIKKEKPVENTVKVPVKKEKPVKVPVKKTTVKKTSTKKEKPVEKIVKKAAIKKVKPVKKEKSVKKPVKKTVKKTIAGKASVKKPVKKPISKPSINSIIKRKYNKKATPIL